MRVSLFFVALLCLGGCAALYPKDKIDPAGDLSRRDYLDLRNRDFSSPVADNEPTVVAAPPVPVTPTPLAPPAPRPAKSAARPQLPDKLVSVNVTENVPLRDILIDLGREANVNLELDPRIQGGVIFSAHKQPFSVVIKRLCSLAGLRLKSEGNFMRVEIDEPYQHTYAVNYPSLSRHSTSEVTIATNVFDVDIANINGNGSSGGSRNNGNDNNSIAKISGSSDADFWNELEQSLKQILATSRPTRPLIRDGGDNKSSEGREAKITFSIDRQAGLVTVFGTSAQQESAADYLRQLQKKATAQVLIEARIIEVELADEFQSGINWRTLFDGTFNAAARFGTVGAGAPFTTDTTAADGMFTASMKNSDFSAIINLVRTFGATRVLSSPRLTVLNNQTAVLKVARNEVYFVTTAQFPTTVSVGGVPVSGTPVFSSTPRTVPVGLVMTVQPAIDAENGRVTMTLRPTISRVVSQVKDPSIGLNAAQAGVTDPVESQIPVLAVREMDSVLQIGSGEVAVMGGLMQDSSVNEDQGIPPFDAMPIIGNLAKSRDNKGSTSELVILLRATIIDSPKPDAADTDLYYRYNVDPRLLPLPSSL